MSNASTVWEDMSTELAQALVAAAGDETREKAAIARALARYARERTPHGELEGLLVLLGIETVSLFFDVR